MRTTTRTSTTRTGSTLRGIAVGLALLLTATACADGDNDTDADDTEEVGSTEDEAQEDGTEEDGTEEDGTEEDDAAEDDGDDAGATGDAVALRNINVEPADLGVAVGTTVTFTNEDIVRHTVTAGSPDEPGDAFDDELDSEGDTTTVTFDEEGTFDYFCRLHPTMTGTITVG